MHECWGPRGGVRSAQPTELAGRSGPRPSNEGVVSCFIFGVGKSRGEEIRNRHLGSAATLLCSTVLASDILPMLRIRGSDARRRSINTRMVSRGREYNK